MKLRPVTLLHFCIREIRSLLQVYRVPPTSALDEVRVGDTGGVSALWKHFNNPVAVRLNV